MKKCLEQTRRHRDAVITRVFHDHYVPGAHCVPFSMEDIRGAIKTVARNCPGYRERNVADVRYQYAAGRSPLPKEVEQHGPWMIQGRGKAQYAFVKVAHATAINISSDLQSVLIPDATPEIVVEYAGSDEQGLLAKLRYNRLLDIFLGITCYHLQNHLRTSLPSRGQCEIDDLYVGLDVDGHQYVIPIEAKSKRDNLSKTQVVQLVSFASARYPRLHSVPVGVQELKDGDIVLLRFTAGTQPDDIKIKEQRRYRLAAMSDCLESLSMTPPSPANV